MRDVEVVAGKRGEEGARGPEMAALNPARSKTGFARHTKAPPRDEGSGKKKKRKKKETERARKEESTTPPTLHHRPFLLPLVGK